MRQLMIVSLIVLTSYCSIATARCLTKEEHIDMLVSCAESTSPGITASNEGVDQVRKAVIDYFASQYGATLHVENDTTSDSLKKISEVVGKCYSFKLADASPELTKIWKDCDERTNFQYKMREKCVKDEFRKICSSLALGRPRRSPVPDLDVLVWSAAQ